MNSDSLEILYRNDEMEPGFAKHFRRIAGNRNELRFETARFGDFVERHLKRARGERVEGSSIGRVELGEDGLPIFSYDGGNVEKVGSAEEGDAFLEKVYVHENYMEVIVVFLDDPKVRWVGCEKTFFVAAEETLVAGRPEEETVFPAPSALTSEVAAGLEGDVASLKRLMEVSGEDFAKAKTALHLIARGASTPSLEKEVRHFKETLEKISSSINNILWRV